MTAALDHSPAFVAWARAKNVAYSAERWAWLRAANKFLGLPAPVRPKRKRDPRPDPGVIDFSAEDLE